MNQIIVTGEERANNTKKEKKVLGINTIVIFYAISIIILGICIISGSVYAKDKITKEVEANASPSVQIDRNDNNNTVEIKVSHIRAITKIEYNWNEEEVKIINTNNQKNITESIDLPGGTNTLIVKITEENGKTATYQKKYTVGNIPKIELEAVSNGVKVISTSEDEIDYITYSWDDGEQQKIEVGKNNYEGIINAPKGQHTLKIEVVDKNKNKATKTQVVVGATAPTANIKADIIEGKLVFVIDAEDSDKISYIELTLNEGEKQTINVNEKTYHGQVEMIQGENRLKISVYNESGLETTIGRKFDNK